MNFLPIIKNNKFILIVVFILTIAFLYTQNKIELIYAQEQSTEEVEANNPPQENVPGESTENTPTEEVPVEIAPIEAAPVEQINAPATNTPEMPAEETITTQPAEEQFTQEIVEESEYPAEETKYEPTKEFIPEGMYKKNPAPVKILKLNQTKQDNLKLNINKNTQNFCNFSPNKINLRSTNYLETTVNIHSGDTNNYLIVGDTPKGINIKIKENNQSEYSVGTKKSVIISISKNSNSQKGSFNIPIILSSNNQGIKSDSICQLIIEN
jgi:hypothetical protein